MVAGILPNECLELVYSSEGRYQQREPCRIKVQVAEDDALQQMQL